MTIPKRTAVKRVSDKRLAKHGGKMYSTIKKKPRPAKETNRIYGPKARRAWMKTLPCSACGVVGYSEGAHVLGNGGTGRKADADTQAPLCGPRPIFQRSVVRTGLNWMGCHRFFDEYRSKFDWSFPWFNPEEAAAATEKLWQDHLKEKGK